MYPGAKLSKGESLTALLGYMLRHHVTKAGSQDLLHLLQMLLPENSLPSTNYLFKRAFDTTSWQLHHYCLNPDCGAYIGILDVESVLCPMCDTECKVSEHLSKGYYLMYTPLRDEIKNLFENHNLNEKLSQKNNSDCIQDISDGTLYKRIPMLTDQGNISLTWNTDGVPVFNSSSYSMWPIQCTINEVHPSERKNFVLVPALWFGQTKPKMESFLKPFIEECRSLESEGVVWHNTVTKTYECSKVAAILCTVDSVARAPVQNLNQFNGAHGCNFCTHSGERVEKGDGFTRVYPLSVPIPSLRTHKGMIHDAELASVNNPVNGVKGPSLLTTLQCFDMAESFVPDYLHSVLLGVVRQITGLWFDNKVPDVNVKNPSVLKEIDKRLKSVRPPSEITRLPRSVKERQKWKGSEWRTFLLISPFILMGLIPTQYFHHWMLLAFAVYLLTSSHISHVNIDKAHMALCEFVLLTESLYGKQEVSYNIHLLTHLAESVRRHGPLSLTSTFVFEGHNGRLLKLFNGTQHVPLQITQNLARLKELKILSRVYIAEDSLAHEYVSSTLRGYSLCKNVARVSSCNFFGHGQVKELPMSQHILLQDSGIHTEQNQATYFQRFVCDGTLYSTDQYDSKYSRCNSLVTIGQQVAKIEHIIVVQTQATSKQPVLLVRLTNQIQAFHKKRTEYVCMDSHILNVTFCAGYKAVLPSEVTNKCIEIVKRPDGLVILPLPNTYERD